MSKEAMTKALEALKELAAQTETGLFAVRHDHVAMQDARQAITALREALAHHSEQHLDMVAEQALNRMADNARELGLDYEPAQKAPAPLRDAIVVNLVREGINKHRARELADHFIGLAAKQQEPWGYGSIRWDQKVFVPHLPSVRDDKWLPLYTSPPAQPTVPDALTIADKESFDYHEGWNDCRALMLEMRKP